MAVDQWYYVTPYKKKRGPITRERLFVLYLKETVLPSTLVWKPGMDTWQSFSVTFDGIVPPNSTSGPPPVPGSASPESEVRARSPFPLHGRVGRDVFWVWLLVLVGLQIVATFIIMDGNVIQPQVVDGYRYDLRPSVTLAACIVISVIMLWPGVSVFVRRCHDIGVSGWWAWLVAIPYIGLLILIVVGGFVPGSPECNRFGPPPQGVPTSL